MDVTQYIEHWEGRRSIPYDDKTGIVVPAGGKALGTLTCGVGHTGPDVVAGAGWTDDRIDMTFAADIVVAATHAKFELGQDYWAALDEIRRAALIDMTFEMGGGGLHHFPRMLAAIRGKMFETAAFQCGNRDPLPTGGVFTRMEANATILRTGQWPNLEL